MNRDAEAARVVRTYSDMIMRLCYSYLRSTADAEDVCQEVLLKLLARRKSIKNTDHEKAWVIRAACNRCKDLLKSGAYRLRADENEIADQDTPAPYFGPLTDALATLTPEQRLAIHLHYYEGYQAKEIAEMMSTTPDAVYQHLSRGRAQLRTQLQGAHHD